MGSIAGSGRSLRGGHGNPLQYSFLENPMHWGVWWATVHGDAEAGITERLSIHTHTHTHTHTPGNDMCCGNQPDYRSQEKFPLAGKAQCPQIW